MTESVFFLNKNYRVKSEELQDLLARLHIGESTTEDAQGITNLHLAYFEPDTTFMTNLKHDQKLCCYILKMVWCTRGWAKFFLKITFLRVF